MAFTSHTFSWLFLQGQISQCQWGCHAKYMLETERQRYFSKSQLGIGYGANGCHPLCQDFLNDNYPLVLSGCVQLLLHFEFTSSLLVEKFNFWSHWYICYVEGNSSNAFKIYFCSVRHCMHSCLSKELINHFKHSNIHKIKAQRMQIWKRNTVAAAQKEVCTEESITDKQEQLAPIVKGGSSKVPDISLY